VYHLVSDACSDHLSLLNGSIPTFKEGDAVEKYTPQLEEAIKLCAGRKAFALKPKKNAVVSDSLQLLCVLLFARLLGTI
jgi:hypothetical protein